MENIDSYIKNNFKKDVDFGVIPHVGIKPTLLKGGAEKICDFLGIIADFEILDQTRDQEAGYFDYQIKCVLYKDGLLRGVGFGTCNTREAKFVKKNAFTMDNTVQKIAVKRAFVDAVLRVACLSSKFTQDIEDILKEEPKKEADYIDDKQQKKLYALANGNVDTVKKVVTKHGYKASMEIDRKDYNKICDEIANSE